jgi:hypothetical protein
MRQAALSALLLLAACAEEPTPAEAEGPIKKTVQDDTEKELDAEVKTIERAADAAAKLVEEEANEEIAAIRGGEAK